MTKNRVKPLRTIYRSEEDRRLNPEKPETLKDEVNDEDERQNSGDERNEKKSSKSKLKPTDKKKKIYCKK